MRRQALLTIILTGVAMPQDPAPTKAHVEAIHAAGVPVHLFGHDGADLAFAPQKSTVMFMAADAGGANTVKGVPYQGEGVSEFAQTLADGTRIQRRSSTKLARDSEGRTRQEHKLGDDGPNLVTIHDPVAEVTYTLNDRDKKAHKLKPFRVKVDGGEASGAVQAFAFSDKEKATIEHDIVFERHVAPPPGKPGAVVHAAPMAFGVAGGHVRFMSRDDNAKTESLGTQTVEGVLCEGTRISHTIPAGEIGNDRPLTTTTERWYSNDLQVVVLSRTNDPMSGETVYRLTNIRRTEPDKSLFQVPADYTVVEPPAPSEHRKILLDKLKTNPN
jgi:hypothetical protein